MRYWLLCLCAVSSAQGLEIKVDYRFDTAGFFEQPGARDAMEAAAARWSRIIDQELLPVAIGDEDFDDRRIQLIHPETNQVYQLSVAESKESDFLVELGAPAADEYLEEGFILGEDEWILYVGSRSLSFIAESGAVQGIFLPALPPPGVIDAEEPSSFVNRGFNVGNDSFPVIGGFVTFSTNVDWNFNVSASDNATGIDFYSVALHEIGHGLGLNTKSSMEWTDLVMNGSFMGENALTAYNEDTGEMETSLDLQSLTDGDFHWLNNTYDSKIFPFGSPNLSGTVGLNQLQDLLMETGFSFGRQARFEITNVDAAALRDLGWSLITEDPPLPPPLPLEFTVAEGGGLSLCIASKEGSTYTIQTATNGVNWLNVTPSLEGDGGKLSWSDGEEGFTDPYGPAADLSGKFYRVIETTELGTPLPQ